MPIDVRWEDERGKVLGECPRWIVLWDYINSPDEIRGTYCLQFIDEYGNTTFNQYQLPVLLEELESLLPKSKSEGARESIEAVIEFILRAKGKGYIKFCGD